MPKKLKKLYPDLFAAGGLRAALSTELQQRRCNLEALGGMSFAEVNHRERHSQVMLGAEQRLFGADFWHAGVQYGHGWAKTLGDVAAALITFLSKRADADSLAKKHPWIDMYDNVQVHEQGPELFVTKAWAELKSWLYNDEPKDSPMRQLLPLIEAASACAPLRALLPFTSHNILCFSRTTGYPYTDDCPSALPIGDNLYKVVCWRDAVLLGKGDANVAAKLLVDNLPPGCGPAVHGTADDLGLGS